MFETLSILPLSFWVTAAILAVGALWAMSQMQDGLGLPVLAVLGTVAAWYVGDVFYNDYAQNHAQAFNRSTLSAAWWQVAWFLTVFLLLTVPMNRWLNRRLVGCGSQIALVLRNRRQPANFQFHLRQLLAGCAILWSILAVIAVIRVGAEVPYYFFPFLGHRTDPWGRGQIGGGISALLSLAGYFQIFIAGVFGIVAALATDRRVRVIAAVGCALTWPYFLFDRTRNTMLAIALPAILAWVFLRLRLGLVGKVAVLGLCFLVVNGWFKFVIENRSTLGVVAAFEQKGFSSTEEEDAKHAGLNMYEELCWINFFIADGNYEPNWGKRYFAEIVNPIPRVLWANKPLIGLDYAVARGQAYTESGTTATISTGMIGQGVVNFGRVIGPAFAAFLMSLWVAVLVRLDLRGKLVGRLPLYGVGLVLTFNLGRDITFITLYTFVFGYVVVWWIGRMHGRRSQPSVKKPASARERRGATPVKVGPQRHSRRTSSRNSRVSAATRTASLDAPDKSVTVSPVQTDG